MKHKEVFITNSSKETQKVGEYLRLQGQALPKQALIIALYGDLGGGKTTFTQGVAKGLGIKKRIISPTFVIVRQYKLKNYSSSEGRLGDRSREVKDSDSSRLALLARTINFYHIDLYRIENKNDIEGLGIDEILKNPENIVVIEWADRLGDLLPKERVDVYFEYVDDERRRITICHPEFIRLRRTSLA